MVLSRGTGNHFAKQSCDSPPHHSGECVYEYGTDMYKLQTTGLEGVPAFAPKLTTGPQFASSSMIGVIQAQLKSISQ